MSAQVEAESSDWSGLSLARCRHDARIWSGPSHMPEPIIERPIRSLIQPIISEHQASDGLSAAVVLC